MIFKGKAIADALHHAFHLQKIRNLEEPKTADWNDEVEIVCTHNLFSSADLKSAAMEMMAVASGSPCLKPFYALAINPDRAGGMVLCNEEGEHSAKTVLKELGFLPNHQWLLVRHKKHGREHFHVLANRVDPFTLKAVHLGFNYVKHEKVARALEQFFDLPTVPGVFVQPTRDSDQRPMRSKRKFKEEQQAKRTGLPIATVETDIVWAWESSVNGAEFLCRLEERSYQIAHGDRRDVVVLDAMGGVHNPARRLGIRAPEFRAKTRDLLEIELPHVGAFQAELARASKADEPEPDADETLNDPLTESPAEVPGRDPSPK